MALATGAGLLLKSLTRVLHVESGFQTAGVTAVDLNLPAPRYRAARTAHVFRPRDRTHRGAALG